jgi:hypothetical protein
VKHVALLLMFGWFFAYQHGLEGYPGSLVRGVAGPFANKASCETLREELQGMFEFLEIPNAKIQESCVERKDV